MYRALTAALICVPLLASDALAQQEPAAMDTAYVDSGSPRSKADGWMIPPGKTGTLGLELGFLTSKGPLSEVTGGPSLEFTDVVVSRFEGRYSLAGVAELIVDTTLLPKQPSYADESVFQNAGLGFRVGLTKWLAAMLRFDGGITLAKSGGWGQGALGVEGRFPIEDYVQFDLSLFGAATSLFIDDEAPRFVELGTGAQLVFFEEQVGGAWFGTSFHFPLAEHQTENWAIDPRVRVGVQIGGVLSAIDKWDIYGKFAFIDRGDLVDLDTVLPILDGGFDQQVLSIGVIRRFGDEPNGTW